MLLLEAEGRAPEGAAAGPDPAGVPGLAPGAAAAAAPAAVLVAATPVPGGPGLQVAAAPLPPAAEQARARPATCTGGVLRPGCRVRSRRARRRAGLRRRLTAARRRAGPRQVCPPRPQGRLRRLWCWSQLHSRRLRRWPRRPAWRPRPRAWRPRRRRRSRRRPCSSRRRRRTSRRAGLATTATPPPAAA